MPHGAFTKEKLRRAECVEILKRGFKRAPFVERQGEGPERQAARLAPSVELRVYGPKRIAFFVEQQGKGPECQAARARLAFSVEPRLHGPERQASFVERRFFVERQGEGQERQAARVRKVVFVELRIRGRQGKSKAGKPPSSSCAPSGKASSDTSQAPNGKPPSSRY